MSIPVSTTTNTIIKKRMIIRPKKKIIESAESADLNNDMPTSTPIIRSTTNSTPPANTVHTRKVITSAAKPSSSVSIIKKPTMPIRKPIIPRPSQEKPEDESSTDDENDEEEEEMTRCSVPILITPENIINIKLTDSDTPLILRP